MMTLETHLSRPGRCAFKVIACALPLFWTGVGFAGAAPPAPRELYRMNLAGEKSALRTLDRPIDGGTLRCSSDGGVIFYLNVDHHVAHIIQDGVGSEYALSEAFTNQHLRFGSLMSPDGSAFAIDVDHLVNYPSGSGKYRGRVVILKILYAD
jgi:hypothetical protein